MNGLVKNRRSEFKRLAAAAGFELAGVAPANEPASYPVYQQWVADGMAGPMTYLTDHRSALRASARNLLPSARSVLCLGKLYNSQGDTSAGVSRYAWGTVDYHDLLRQQLGRSRRGG